jgi:hypothetical protein
MSVNEHEFIEAHAMFERRFPDEQEYAQSVDNHRRAQWLQAHNTIDGYVSLRQFPCPGSLRVIERTKSHKTIECDACGYLTTAPVGARETEEAF